jgi:hypothetical protein
MKRRWWAYILFLLLLMFSVAWLMPSELGVHWWPLAWIINLVLLLGVVICISLWAGAEGTKGGALAILADKNRMSLSRFQIVLWTVIVLSAFWTIAIARAADSMNPQNAAAYVCEVDEEPCAPADLQLPAELWALMGISLTSAVASPLIKESKKQRTKGEPEYTLEPDVEASLASDDYTAVGAVVEGTDDRDPKLSDLFMGEDVGNVKFVDMARVQNFFFTIVAVVVYGGVLWAAMAGAKSISALFQFPDLSPGLVAILGISHAGYLVNKNTSVSPTPTTPPKVTSISPERAKQTAANVQVTIEGENFRGTPQVLLTGVGPDILASAVTVVAGTRISCSFNISSADPGARRLLVVNPDSTQGYKDSAFTITA